MLLSASLSLSPVVLSDVHEYFLSSFHQFCSSSEIVNFLFYFAVEFLPVKGLVVAQNTMCSGTSIFMGYGKFYEMVWMMEAKNGGIKS